MVALGEVNWKKGKTMREKLIELVGQVQDCGCDVTDVVEMNYVENNVLVDHLIANGVVIQPDCQACANATSAVIANLQKRIATDNNVGDKWIPVTERLPEDRQKVLCFKQAKYGSCVMTANFSECLEKYCDVDFRGVKHGGFFSYDSEVGYYELREVTHWMHLPEPQKGE